MREINPTKHNIIKIKGELTMSKVSDALINRMDIAKGVLKPLFVETFKAPCVECCVDEELSEMIFFVESDIDDTNKFFKLDFENAPKEQLFWDDKKLKEYFKDKFETLKENPVDYDETISEYRLLEEW